MTIAASRHLQAMARDAAISWQAAPPRLLHTRLRRRRRANSEGWATIPCPRVALIAQAAVSDNYYVLSDVTMAALNRTVSNETYSH